MTGGKLRDTLAGLYDDRAARRFAYKPLFRCSRSSRRAAMLLGVAARRLGVPVFVSAMFGRARAQRRQGEADQRAALAFAEAREKTRAQRSTATSEALLAKKRRATSAAAQSERGNSRRRAATARRAKAHRNAARTTRPPMNRSLRARHKSAPPNVSLRNAARRNNRPREHERDHASSR